MIRYLICGLAAVTSISVAAQDGNTAEPAAAVPSVVAPAPTLPVPAAVVRAMSANTLLTVTPIEEISSKRIDVGSKAPFTTIGDVSEQGVVVIPRGSLVSGEITFKTGKAIGGKSGKFELAFKSVQVRGVDYTLTGVHRQEGKGNTVAAVFGSLLVSGRSAVMQPGQEARAFTSTTIPY